jgi:hypothetical protein
MSRNVLVNSEPQKYGQNVSVGPHVFYSDEPGEYGGADEGPTAVEHLTAALGACASVTVHPHPTLSETIMEAAEMFYGTSTDIYRPKR